MNKKKAIVIGSIAAAVVLLGVGLWFAFGRKSSSSGEDVVYVSPISILTNAGSMGIPNRFSGVVEPQKTLDIQLQQEKTVKEILVAVGQDVNVGTPLFTYDTEQMEGEVSQAQLDIDRINNDINNLYSQINTLEKEKKAASNDEKLNYTTQIQMAQMDIKKNEYELKSKNIEIQKLRDSIQNATVTSEIAGVVKTINQGGNEDMSGGTSNAFMTILQTGQFRIKGSVNEQNMSAIMEGEPVIIRSRVDDSTWKGTLGKVDTENATTGSSGAMYYGGGSSNEESQSSNYPFYVELESADGLMLGQHVYIEMDYGQEEERIGVWIPEYLIADVDTEPYVWADDGKGKLTKKSVILGQYDENMMLYEIAEGLEESDAVTFPEDSLEEGMATEITSDGSMGNQAPMEDMGGEEGMMEEGMMDEGAMEEGMEDGSVIGGSDGSTDVILNEEGSGAVSFSGEAGAKQ